MRYLILLAAFAVACDDFSTVQRTDTIEAYEAYLKENGETSANGIASLARLEVLYKKRAEEKQDVPSWDAYLARFPKGPDAAAFREARELALFHKAELEGTEAGWRAFLDACPAAQTRRVDMAKAGMLAAAYAPSLTIGEVQTKPVNLADDPKGPMNGTGWSAEITNKGDKTLSLLWFTLVLPDASGGVAGTFDGPLVAPQSASRMPIAAKDQVPFKPGETRTWTYTTDVVPP
ncbi:MAG TPA: hypothetical protein PKA64_18045, partial [Myxococcota bacterium]|nr:hypothetical protein [Myxococcota bacterium]